MPAIGLAKNLIESGRLGRIYHWRAVYLQDWITDPNCRGFGSSTRPLQAPVHVTLDSHLIDLALYLVGRMTRVVGMDRFIKQRPAPAEQKSYPPCSGGEGSSGLEPVDVDDATLFLAVSPMTGWHL